MIVYPSTALATLLNAWVAHAGSDQWRLHLFQNDLDLDRGSVLGDFQESDYPGYESQLTGAFSPATIDLDGNAVSLQLGIHDFSRGKPIAPAQRAYGWYLTDVNGDLLAAELFPAPALFASQTDGIKIQLRFTYGECPEVEAEEP